MDSRSHQRSTYFIMAKPNLDDLATQTSETGPCETGSVSKRRTTCSVKSIPDFHSIIDPEKTLAKLADAPQPEGKTIKCYGRCLACPERLGPARMNIEQILCQPCFDLLQGLDRVSQSRRLNALARSFRSFMRARLEGK